MYYAQSHLFRPNLVSTKRSLSTCPASKYLDYIEIMFVALLHHKLCHGKSGMKMQGYHWNLIIDIDVAWQHDVHIYKRARLTAVDVPLLLWQYVRFQCSYKHVRNHVEELLTHWGRIEIDAILQMAFSISLKISLKFVPSFELTIF